MSKIRVDEDVIFDFWGPKVHGDSTYGFMPDGVLVRRSNYLGDWIEVDYSELTANQFRELIEELGKQIVRNRKEQNEREANQARVSLRGGWDNSFFLGTVTIGEDREYVGDCSFEELADMPKLLTEHKEVLVSFEHDVDEARTANRELGGESCLIEGDNNSNSLFLIPTKS